MRVGLQTWGSDGDIRPLIALGGGLRAAGHEAAIVVTSADNKDYGDLCCRLDLPYVKVPGQIPIDLPGLLGRVRRASSARALKVIVEEAFFPYQEVMFEAAKELCRRSDLIVGHLATYPAKAAAIQTGVPFVATIYWPGFLPSAGRPPVRMPNLGPPLNRLEWKLLQAALDFFLKGRIAQFWKRHNLPPFRHLVPDLWSSDLLNLLAASPLLWPEEPDWGGRFRLCGFFNIPDPAEQVEGDAHLQSFLDDGEAPVYMTLGATGQVDPHRGTRLMVSAARAAGCRAVVQTLSPDFPAGSRDGDICFTGPGPHSRVFQRCAAVVHHGGAGTTHTATRAGKPSVVVAFTDEQLSWGRQLYRAGVAPRPMGYRRAKPQPLAAVIRAVLADPALRSRADQLGEAMRQENGVALAVEILEELHRSL